MSHSSPLGGTWTLLSNPSPGPSSNTLTSVWCRPGYNWICLAGGDYLDSTGVRNPLVEEYR
jgi:hypothetical protein